MSDRQERDYEQAYVFAALTADTDEDRAPAKTTCPRCDCTARHDVTAGVTTCDWCARRWREDEDDSDPRVSP